MISLLDEAAELSPDDSLELLLAVLELLLAALDPNHEKKVVSGREGIVGARSDNEIGVLSLRGGTVAGEHTVYLFGEDETISIKHSAASRRICRRPRSSADVRPDGTRSTSCCSARKIKPQTHNSNKKHP